MPNKLHVPFWEKKAVQPAELFMMPIHTWYETVAKPEWQQAAQVQDEDFGKGEGKGKDDDFGKGEGKGKAFDKGKGKGKGKEVQRGGWLDKFVQLAVKIKAEDWAACTMLVDSYSESSESFARAFNSEINRQRRHHA